MPLLCCEAVPSDGLCCVLCYTITVLKKVAQVELSFCMPLFRCQSDESRCLSIVLRNTLAVLKH